MNYIFAFLFLLSWTSYCQIPTTPPGTLKVNDSLYIDSTPITNFMFVEYLHSKHYLEKKGFKSFKEYSEDSLDNEYQNTISDFEYPSYLLESKNPQRKILKRKKYQIDTLYTDHPVLNVSKEQAVDYCKWRTEVVNVLWFNEKNNSMNKEVPSKVVYRLPTRREFLMAKSWFDFKNLLMDYQGQKVLSTLFPYNPEGYRTLSISEYTASEELFIKVGKNKKDFIGFRCICEVTF